MKNTLETLRACAIPAVAMAALSFGASAQDAEVLKLDIEPQQAGPALMELASSSGVQIMLPDQAGAAVEVKGLRGEYMLEEALAALLTDTGLAYEFTSENVVLVQQSQQSEELQEVEAADDSAATAEEDEPIELEKQVVTGSRIEGGDPSARTYSYTAEDIAARGVSTLEEFFRTLPWTYSSITTQTNMSEFYQGTDQEGEYIELGLGISTVNLRNMGSANTLVLVNGRRIAGTGEEDDFANILTIPLSAIERVDIQLDGASAVYGSDAIGGVVNFITKRNYSGLSLHYRNEFSSTDADQTKASITGGYAWGSGNVTAILSRDTSDPITNNKTGFTTLDLRPSLGPEFDLRSITTGQPGVACEYSPVFASQPATIRCKRRTPMYQLPASHSGAGATVAEKSGICATFGRFLKCATQRVAMLRCGARFAHAGLQRFYERGEARRLDPQHIARIREILTDLDAALGVSDLRRPGLRLHPLKGKLRGFWSVRVSGNWRIVFRSSNGEAVDVDLRH